MWSVIVTQLLTLALALLGALLGVIFGTWFIPGQRLNPRAWQWIIVLGLISIGAIVYLVAEARAIEHRIKVVGRRIRKEVDLGATLEYDYRNGASQTNQDIEAAVEEWRSRVDRYLRRELPGSGADIRFRTGIGEIGPGHAYEHTRLKDLKQNLLAVLDALPSYVQRSR
jgi:hypothetical protein